MSELHGAYPELMRRGIFKGLDLNVLAARFWRLDAMRAEGKLPTIKFRAYQRGGSWGTAWMGRNEITMRMSVNASVEGVIETLLHEMVHCAGPANENHGELFCRRLIACAREAFGLNLDTAALLDVPIGRHSRRAYAIDESIVTHMREAAVVLNLRADINVAFKPAPVETEEQIAAERTKKREYLIAKRREHAAAKLAEWEREIKRAKALAQKWRTKVRYYEKREAMAAKARETKS